MTPVGLIGSGQIGSAIARLAIAAGHEVVLSNSRGPETLADMDAVLGSRASAATSGEAALAGDNYGPERDGHIPDLDSESLTSSEPLLTEFIESLGYCVVWLPGG